MSVGTWQLEESGFSYESVCISKVSPDLDNIALKSCTTVVLLRAVISAETSLPQNAFGLGGQS